MPDRDIDAVVVGAGPAGLAAAIAAQRHGLRTVVLDGAHHPPLDKTCGEGLMPDGVAALKQLGVHPARDQCVAFRGIRFFDGAASIEAGFGGATGIGIRRTVLHELLARHAFESGVELRWGTRATGLFAGGVLTAAGAITCRWVIGADGLKSRLRELTGLEAVSYERRRYGHRQHFEISPWTDMVEVYWGRRCQIVVTPVGPSLVCAALVSHDPQLHVRDAISDIPALARRLLDAPSATAEKGAITAVRVLHDMVRKRFALVGDASGSVDAITGQGLCLSFRQAVALGEALRKGNLLAYSDAHRRFARKPVLMSRFMLAMDRYPAARSVVMRVLAACPPLFERLVQFHIGARYATNRPNVRKHYEAYE